MSEMPASTWQVWIDTGGTFTDCLTRDPNGNLRRAKVLSSSSLRGTVAMRLSPTRLRVEQKWSAPDDFIRGFAFRLLGVPHDDAEVVGFDPFASIITLAEPLEANARPGQAFEVVSPEEAPIMAARLATGAAAERPLPPLAMRLGTTRGTNALLQRRGAPTALLITRGFADLPAIGTQARPDLFALNVVKSPPLHAAVIEVDERLANDGSVLRPLDLDVLAGPADALLARGVRSAAVALMHSYRNDAHERRVAQFLLARGFEHVSCSADLAPFIKLLPRTQTAVVDAFLSPVIDDYLHAVAAAIAKERVDQVHFSTLHVMTSAGGLVRAANYHAKDSLLSGPAGGVAGAAVSGRRSGFQRVIAFDMGGTSTDVARIDGDYEYVFEHSVGDARLVAPALAIESVAAGGGSICRFDGQRLRVGPESAGARPGPACYGAGGPLTITDANLLLGRLDGSRFEIPIDPAAARARLDELRDALQAATGESPDPDALLAGLLDIANERMADAISRISVARGYDPNDYALVAFGGAGAQHACPVADRLGIATIVVPPDAGLLSAMGIGHAPIERFAERQVLARLDDVTGEIDAAFAELATQAVAALRDEGVPADEVAIRRRIANLRFVGQDFSLAIDCDPAGPALADAFDARYREVYGHRPAARAIEVESLRVIASGQVCDAVQPAVTAAEHTPSPAGCQSACFDGDWVEAATFERDQLRHGARINGPALVFEAHSATVIPPGWAAHVDGAGAIVLRRMRQAAAATAAAADRPEAVMLELFTNRFRAIAEQMGAMLQRTALSVNVKERLDFSCALLDAGGELVVNAPHIPVHLGAIGLCVRDLARRLDLKPGDVAVTNHPACGGSHLPDMTVVTPVHVGGRLVGYVASRAHHAEIGGSRPGSMPPAARSLAEEGVVVPPTLLVRAGQERWEAMRELLTTGPCPTRAVEDNLADLAAAVAANHRGAAALSAMVAEHGTDTVAHYMVALKSLAARHTRAALAALPTGRREAVEHLDDGTPIRVTIELAGDEPAVIDFAGSGGVHPGNLNATPAIVRSAVIYVLRLLVRQPLPLNEGIMQAVEVRVPPGLLNPDFPDDPGACPAVVGGNVETSQRIVDTLLKAFGVAACSQGTMNNVLFGGPGFGYYETVCGGCGAGPDFDGASAVHSHMTNTRITDPEVIEHRYPVRLERFAIRLGSGGAGRHRGGDGVVREYTFLAPLSLSLLTQHRVQRPYGLAGGQPGATGVNRIVRADGREQMLGPVDGCDVGPGDRLILETPGGGGYGMPAEIR
ncbi:MAG: hypothetical protein BIFFINMI_00357 [Phycisphaerae bacterium]|nr:hypothetical protein [Phycisphaerae bacterium]